MARKFSQPVKLVDIAKALIVASTFGKRDTYNRIKSAITPDNQHHINLILGTGGITALDSQLDASEAAFATTEKIAGYTEP